MRPGSQIIAIAGVNTHYPALLGPDQPELLLTQQAAQELGLYPPDPSWRSVIRMGIGGQTRGWFVERALQVSVVELDREGPQVIMHAYILPGFSKLLISDAGIKPLGVWLVDEARGYWCFQDELLDVIQSRRNPRSGPR